MVPNKRLLATVGYQIYTFSWIWTVSEDITQADNSPNISLVDVFKHFDEGFEVAVDVTDDRCSHGGLGAVKPRMILLVEDTRRTQ